MTTTPATSCPVVPRNKRTNVEANAPNKVKTTVNPATNSSIGSSRGPGSSGVRTAPPETNET